MLYVPVITVMLVLAIRAGQSRGEIVLLVVGGALVWSLLEYVIHRFVFHPPQWVEEETRTVTARLRPEEAVIPALPTWRHKFYFLVHGVHHDDPNDSGRLVMPPSVSIPLAIIFYFLFQWALGPLMPAAFAGLVGGYLCVRAFIRSHKRRLSTASGISAGWRPILRHQPQLRLDCSPPMRPFSHKGRACWPLARGCRVHPVRRDLAGRDRTARAAQAARDPREICAR